MSQEEGPRFDQSAEGLHAASQSLGDRMQSVPEGASEATIPRRLETPVKITSGVPEVPPLTGAEKDPGSSGPDTAPIHDMPTLAPASALPGPELAETLIRREPEVPGRAVATGWDAGSQSLDVDAQVSERMGAKRVISYIGDYELLEEIAHGGMGVVFKARQVSLNRLVAIKMILSAQFAAPAEVRRFRLEAEAAANLDHPNIVPIFEVGEHEGRQYFSMGLVEGQSLAARVATGPLDPREAAGLVRDIALAIQYAHEQGVIHRDLKPANILIDRAGTPRVTDFGLAKQTRSESGLTASGDVMGTPSYMPPEQAAGKTSEIGPAADIYALGSLLYCVITGRPPFQAATVTDTLLQVLDQEPVPPRRLNPGLDRDLETICLKCLEKEPRKRFDSARVMADELGRFLAGEPIQARPIGAPARAWRWCKRKPALASLAAGIVLALLVGTVVSSWQAIRASRQELRTRAVLNFFEGQVLAAARPEGKQGGLGREATIRQAVDAAEPKIAAAFSDQPVVEAAIRDTLGKTYLYLGEASTAIHQFERAAELRLAQFGPVHAETLDSRNNLAKAYEADGRTTDGITIREATLKLMRSKLGANNHDTLVSRANLAVAYLAAGRIAEGKKELEGTLKQMEAKLGTDHPATLMARNALAMAASALAGSDKIDSVGIGEAIKLQEDTLKERESKLGQDDPKTLAARGILAEFYGGAGRTVEAIAMLEGTLKLLDSKFGFDHTEAFVTRDNLALAYQAAGRTAEAITTLEATLKVKESKLGPDHPDTLLSRSYLASAYQLAGRSAESLEMHEVTLKLRESKLGPSHPDTLNSRLNLALSYQAAGQVDRAVTLSEQALHEFRRKVGSDHRDLVATEFILANAYSAAGQPDKAEPLLRGALEWSRKQLGAGGTLTASAMSRLGQCLCQQRKWSEAEPFLRQSLAIAEKSQPEEWATFHTRSMLGGSLLGQKRYEEAEPLILAGYEGMKVHKTATPALNKLPLSECAERVVELYEAWGKTDEAAKWRSKLARPVPETEAPRP
jgi:eukaryotic-like serine/threonine-protein kinase